MRRGLVLSAVKQALIFAVLVGLTWSLRATHTASVLGECPPFTPFGYSPPSEYSEHLPRHFGPDFLQDLDAKFGRPVTTSHNFGEIINLGAALPSMSDVQTSKLPNKETQHHKEHKHRQEHRAHGKTGCKKHKHEHSAHSEVEHGDLGKGRHKEHDHDHRAHRTKNRGVPGWPGRIIARVNIRNSGAPLHNKEFTETLKCLRSKSGHNFGGHSIN